MINKILDIFKSLDKLTKIIMRNGLVFCSIITFVSLLILITYDIFIIDPYIFMIGFSLLKLSFTFAIEFIICGFVADKIKKQLT